MTAFQFNELWKNVMKALKNPEDCAQWNRSLELMCRMREALRCAKCNKLLSETYSPVEDLPFKLHCLTCETDAQASQNGFYQKDIARCFINLCDLINKKGMDEKWQALAYDSNPNDTNKKPTNFIKLISEVKQASTSDNNLNGYTCNEDSKKSEVKQKRKLCRCGSGKSGPGHLTCQGQRCNCYRNDKGCESCKCVGCKNDKPLRKDPRS